MWEKFLNKKVIIPVIIIVLVVAGYSLYDYFYISEFVKVGSQNSYSTRRMNFYTNSTDFNEIRSHARSIFHEEDEDIYINYFNNREYTPEDSLKYFPKKYHYHYIARYIKRSDGEESFTTYPSFQKSMIKE